MSYPEVILNLPPPNLNAANGYGTLTGEYNAEIISQCSIEDKDACSNSVSDFPMISIVNSSDVIIGSVTQFHGPVTILQQTPVQESIEGESKINEADMVATDYKTTIPPKKPTAAQHCLPKRLLICFTVLTLLITLIVLSIILVLEQGYSEEDGTETPPGDNLSTKYNFTDHNFYTIAEWGGREPLLEEPVTLPIQYVIISHTVGHFCEAFTDCSAQMRIAQDYHVTRDEPNVGYNFVIGGDGGIYEGRGWTTKNFIKDSSISISFVGNFVHDELTTVMYDAFLEVLKAGLSIGILPEYYRLVAHNQTQATLSPGRNVYKVIKEHPHFYPGLVPQARS